MNKPSLNKKPLRILIAEDDDINAIVFTDLLESEGFLVTRASDGDEALNHLCTGEFDLALIDINLGFGSIDGTEVLKLYKQASVFHKIPIVAVTAFAMQSDKEKFMAAGFDSYLPKPVFMEDLLKLIKDLQIKVEKKQQEDLR